MAKNNYQLTPQQKEEFRRLTQKANRRIAKAFREYEKEGLRLVPKALTGGFVQSKKEWSSQKYALSRSVTQFSSRKDYLSYMQKLRQFDIPEIKGGVPTYTEYQSIGRDKLKQAINTALGKTGLNNLPSDIKKVMDKRIDEMTTQEQSKFWKKFEQTSAKMGMKYSSGAAMESALEEIFFKEDLKPIIIDALVEAEAGLSKQEKADLRKRLKYTKNRTLLDRAQKLKK